MLKKITVDEVVPGMYVHELCGSWFDNPFWAPSFVLRDTADVYKLQASGVRDLWIDTARSQLISSEQSEEPDAPDVNTGEDTGENSDRSQDKVFAFPTQHATSLQDEVLRAAKVVQQSRDAVAKMFGDARMGRIADASAAMPIVDEIATSVLRNSDALISLVRLKQADDYTYMHSVAVCAMMVALAKQLKKPEARIRDLGLAGLLHDIGKMAIPVDILNKPGKLTDTEFFHVKQHPSAGYAMLKETKNIPAIVLDVCLHHHERFDGQGYPARQKGEEISLAARMGAICDVYDAITSNRPYKQGWSPAISLQKMALWTKEGHFDQKVFAAFVKCVGIYPVGTLVKLKSNRLGIVISNDKSLLRPIVKIFFSATSNSYISPQKIDLSVANATEGISSVEEPEDWKFKSIEKFWIEQ